MRPRQFSYPLKLARWRRSAIEGKYARKLEPAKQSGSDKPAVSYIKPSEIGVRRLRGITTVQRTRIACAALSARSLLVGIHSSQGVETVRATMAGQSHFVGKLRSIARRRAGGA